MIMTMILTALLFLMAKVLQEKSPMKMNMKIIASSVWGFMILAIMSKKSMMSMVLTLIFMGGIIMMFMLLSATMPNQKTNKEKKLKLMILISAMSISMMMPELSYIFSSNNGKNNGVSEFTTFNKNNAIMIGIMSIFFIFLNKMMTDFNTPMRNFTC